jgi:hypothetical protein
LLIKIRAQNYKLSVKYQIKSFLAKMKAEIVKINKGLNSKKEEAKYQV